MSSPLAPRTSSSGGASGHELRPHMRPSPLSQRASVDVLRSSQLSRDHDVPPTPPWRPAAAPALQTASATGFAPSASMGHSPDVLHSRPIHSAAQHALSGSRPRRSVSLASLASMKPSASLAPARPDTPPPVLITPSRTRRPLRERKHRLRVPWLESTEGAIMFVALGLRLLLLPSYHSTDMEVHRNWLAITHSLPLSEWYFDTGSEWTLDYPPLFAWFQWLLAQPARFLCPELLQLHNLNNASWPVKLYLRGTVIVSELVYVAAIWALARPPAKHAEPDGLEDGEPSAPSPSAQAHAQNGAATGTLRQSQIVQEACWTSEERRGIRLALFASLLLHPGLIFVDHIHFQYNGFLFAVLFWSFWAARERRPLLSATLFSTLLNLKHIYLYMAPAYFVFLLRSYVIPPGSSCRSFAGAGERLLIVGFFTLLPVVLSLGPLLLSGLNKGSVNSVYPYRSPLDEMRQLLSRLFPFGRGLTHAYWAPNVWAWYTAMDRVLLALFRTAPFLGDMAIAAFPYLRSHLAQAKESGYHVSAASRGLVGDVAFGILPNITPRACALLTLGACTPALGMLMFKPTYISFVHTIVLCAGAAFAFGWHVHEKAVLLLTLPATYLAPLSSEHTTVFSTLTAAATVSLLPLLIRGSEVGAALALSALWLTLESVTLRRYTATNQLVSNLRLALAALRRVYLIGLVLVVLYGYVVHPLLLGNHLPFLPLLLISIYTAGGVLGSYLGLYWLFLTGTGQPTDPPRCSMPGSRGRASSVGHSSGRSSAAAAPLPKGSH